MIKSFKIFENLESDEQIIIDVFQDIIDDFNLYDIGNNTQGSDGLCYQIYINGITTSRINFRIFNSKDTKFTYSDKIQEIYKVLPKYIERLKRIGLFPSDESMKFSFSANRARFPEEPDKIMCIWLIFN